MDSKKPDIKTPAVHWKEKISVIYYLYTWVKLQAFGRI